MFTAQVAGHICIDLTPRLPGAADVTPGALVEVGPLMMRPGGSVSNTGGDLVALGADVQMHADVGDDDLGHTLRELLQRRDGPRHRLRTVPGATTSYSIVVQPHHADRTFWHHVGANNTFDGSSVPLGRADLLHLGYPPILPALLADSGTRLLELLAGAHDAGSSTSVDLCVVDPSSAAGAVDWMALLERVSPYVDILTPSVDDLRSALRVDWLAADNVEAVGAAADLLVEMGACVVMVTAGASGLLLRTAPAERLRRSRVLAPIAAEWGNRRLWVPALPVMPAGTTGAGDAATAGLIFGLLAGMGPERATHLAVKCAADRVQGVGRLTLPDTGDAARRSAES